MITNQNTLRIQFSMLIDFKMKCIPVMAKLNFQQFPVLHDHSEIILKCFNVQETFLNIINVKHSCAV